METLRIIRSTFWVLAMLCLLMLCIAGPSSAATDTVGKAAIKPASSMPIPSVSLLGAAPPARCVKWQYFLHPTKVTATSTPEPGRWVRWCMDGYPSDVSQSLPREHWRTWEDNKIPTKDKPEILTVDYGQPIAVARYVHYFENSRIPCAWKDAIVQSSTDGKSWKTLENFTNLTTDYPQILPITKPSLAQYYRFIITAISEGAPYLASYEIETYYGATLGRVDCGKAVQSEPASLNVHVVSSDTALKGATLKLIAPKGALAGSMETAVPTIAKGAGSVAAFKVTPLIDGPIPVMVKMYIGGQFIDRRPYVIRALPKLTFAEIASADAVQSAGSKVTIKGKLTNTGSSAAKDMSISWMGATCSVASLAPGKSAAFALTATVKPGYSQGALVAKANGLTKTTVLQPIICKAANGFAVAGSKLTVDGQKIKLSLKPAGASNVTGTLQLFASGKQYPLVPVGAQKVAAAVPGAAVVFDVAQKKTSGDINFACKVIPNTPNPMVATWLDMELRVAVDDPKIMFRPHLDWYTVEHGPNTTQLGNGHNSATRMLCIQTDGATVSMVPDTDNMNWGFTKDNEMTIQFQIPLEPHDPLNTHPWRSLNESPTQFSILLPVRKGDWWSAYRYVAQDLFKFEQPKQWAVPVTQMQMFNARYVMNYDSWSEKAQTVRSFPQADVFYNFYGTTYTIPALYSWYLATDNAEAKLKTEKCVKWLLNIQEKEGAAAGGWLSQYSYSGDPITWVGYDQAGNRWVMPHATGTTAKTLLWYWEASGKTDEKVFNAAKKACDWLISKQRADGGWPYAYNLDGKPMTELSDAGQIWCTWALWRMYKYTGDPVYKTAAIRSGDCFKKTFMSIRRYMGYWEDVSGGGGNVTRSWEGYEPGIACLVFSEMGDKNAAIECAKDTVVWSWTRITTTRSYETCYGQTTEQSFCGPSQAQCPMIAVGLEEVYALTGDKIWSDYAGAMKAINFCADPDQGYGMCATTGWCDPTAAVAGPPFDNVRPWITSGNSRGDEYGRGVWIEWQTSQFAWLGLEWLVREGNLRAPQFFKINTDTYRGTVLGDPAGRIKMPEERCDVMGIDHYDINWVGYANDYKYALLVINHKQKTTVAIRPHEAHLDIYTRAPRIFIGDKNDYREAKVVKKGVQYMVEIPANQNAVLVWDRITK